MDKHGTVFYFVWQGSITQHTKLKFMGFEQAYNLIEVPIGKPTGHVENIVRC